MEKALLLPVVPDAASIPELDLTGLHAIVSTRPRFLISRFKRY